MTKCLLGTALATVALAACISALPQSITSAMAADIAPQAYSKAPPSNPAYNWTGFYIGLHGGYAFDAADPVNTSTTSSPVFGLLVVDSTSTDRMKNAFGGLQAGYNMQFGTWLLGVEADGSFGRFKSSTTVTQQQALAPSFFSSTAVENFSFDWLMTVRGRAGYTYNNWLFYGTGGIALAQTTALVTNSVTIANALPNPDGTFTAANSKSQLSVGWAAGGGIEVGISDHISFKSEYLYVKLPGTSLTATLGGPVNHTFDTAFHTARAGLNFRY